jgi:hypothetical protein
LNSEEVLVFLVLVDLVDDHLVVTDLVLLDSLEFLLVFPDLIIEIPLDLFLPLLLFLQKHLLVSIVDQLPVLVQLVPLIVIRKVVFRQICHSVLHSLGLQGHCLVLGVVSEIIGSALEQFVV